MTFGGIAEKSESGHETERRGGMASPVGRHHTHGATGTLGESPLPCHVSSPPGCLRPGAPPTVSNQAHKKVTGSVTDQENLCLAFARTRIAGRRLGTAVPPDLWAAMADAGLFRIGLPLACGGDGAPLSVLAAAERALIAGGGSPGLGTVWAAHQMIPRHFLAGFGSTAQQEAWLPRIAAGTSTAAIAISEPRIGAHPKHLTTRAIRTAAGWRIDGEKSFLTNGPIADLFIVLAITGEAAGRKRYSCLHVPDTTRGLTRTPATDYPALHPAGHCGLRLDGVEVPADALLGPEGEAYDRMALPFRDAEDAVGTSGTAGNIAHMVGSLAAGLPADAPPETAAAIGQVLGLSALLDHAARQIANGLDHGHTDQALMIGLRTLAAHIATELHKHPPTPALATGLAALETGLTVARGPRMIRAARLAMDHRG